MICHISAFLRASFCFLFSLILTFSILTDLFILAPFGFLGSLCLTLSILICAISILKSLKLILAGTRLSGFYRFTSDIFLVFSCLSFFIGNFPAPWASVGKKSYLVRAVDLAIPFHN